MTVARLMLLAAAAILIVGGIAHIASYQAAAVKLAATGLPPGLVAAYDGLWLADSANLWASATTIGFTAWKFERVPAGLIALLALAPLASALIVYGEMGFFYGGHMLLAAALLVFAAAWVKHRRGGVTG